MYHRRGMLAHSVGYFHLTLSAHTQTPKHKCRLFQVSGHHAVGLDGGQLSVGQNSASQASSSFLDAAIGWRSCTLKSYLTGLLRFYAPHPTPPSLPPFSGSVRLRGSESSGLVYVHMFSFYVNCQDSL